MRRFTATANCARRFTQWGAAAAVAMQISSAAGAEVINVKMDQANIARVPPRTATLVVGNPLIADVTVQAGGVMVVTGKGYGVTNIIALDQAGKLLFEKLVRVKSPVESVVVYRGITRESYSCAPYCERRITVGDTPEFFNPTLRETTDRNDSALGKSSSQGGR
jgi:Flp pilus assembly secretin CpaC